MAAISSLEWPGFKISVVPSQSNAAAHARWKASMLRHSGKVISTVDGVLVLNFDKDGDESYIGGATFLEMYEAFLQNKKIFLYNCIPSSILSDEIRGFAPVILQQELKRSNWEEKTAQRC